MEYVLIYLRRAFAGSVLFTDKLSILAAAITPVVFMASGDTMTESIQAYVSLFIIIIVVCFVVMRLLAAPYLIWMDDQSTIKTLRDKIGDPDEIARRSIDADKINDRKKVISFLASHKIKSMIGDSTRNYVSEYRELSDPLNRLILDDRDILPLADKFMSTHSELLKWLRIYAQTNKFSESDMEVMRDSPPVADAYIVARDALYRHVALKESRSPNRG